MTVEPPRERTDSVATKATLTLEDGKTMDADLHIPTTGRRPNTSFISNMLLTTDGRVETNLSTLRADKAGPRVDAIGDVASYGRPAVHLIPNAIPVLWCKHQARLTAGCRKGGELCWRGQDV
ncbi:uncharacterized protein Z518_09888 [Rhinocladiella mackenziei CBS 650.93]|uniref:Rhinocladiella mackenziei CBS 650.93 unplaced genomic scaffold supercont1.8, whole genome shotgun sequence n=1 Tax=Rhinocladiella mackenziei CBS 650.93 TaxID=1442369 RepID=A0A0D2GR75_9EURO|nr:uncharacterized protein Z518_09888 [Rhinocladiella mackenziei CBS 650.93]KIX00823.1 hypothetical protein Z518_09888 [Rhinocladiella mackenziei CBS 650.93]